MPCDLAIFKWNPAILMSFLIWFSTSCIPGSQYEFTPGSQLDCACCTASDMMRTRNKIPQHHPLMVITGWLCIAKFVGNKRSRKHVSEDQSNDECLLYVIQVFLLSLCNHQLACYFIFVLLNIGPVEV